ncbi:MAG TPA: zf-TFIIB domain-containing protein, partial [Candidatus Manganitrophaceae bacterium]|nr:zf-TFIIB domain-containing protein [Candidatus Manganitrophaceae bacterium]
MSETKRCEHCGKQVSRKYTVCPICGGDLRDDAPALPAACPRCKAPLEILAPDGEEYNLCRACGGLWLDKTEFRRATRESDVYRKEETKEEYRRAPARDPVGYIPCVRCAAIMNRKNFG